MDIKNIKELVYSMLTECTGKALCDSGGAYGRHWERNQKKTLADFENEPQVSFTVDENPTDSRDIMLTVSLFHHLTNGSLILDDVCHGFNAAFGKMADWESDIYGTSKEAADWLVENGFTIGESGNSYNGESNLSQVVQTTALKDCHGQEYLLLQIHNGCDVRGGYTDAKLFKPSDYLDFAPTVYGTIDGVQVDTGYNGYSLTNDNGAPVPVSKESKIELFISF